MNVKRITEILTLAVFLPVIFGFAIGFLLLPDREFSEQENRSLRTLPEFTLEKLASGRFAEEINDYYFPPLIGTYLRLLRMFIFFLTLYITPVWYWLIRNPHILGEHYRSKLMQKIVFAGYNKKCGEGCDPNAWLSRDEEVVKAYNADMLSRTFMDRR